MRQGRGQGSDSASHMSSSGIYSSVWILSLSRVRGRILIAADAEPVVSDEADGAEQVFMF